MLPGLRAFTPDEPWQNAHLNFQHSFAKDQSFELFIENDLQPGINDYNQTTANFQFLIKQAIDRKTTLRAVGANWSFSKVAVCNGGMVQTKKLWLNFPLGASTVVPEYLTTGRTHKDLRLVQCGTQIATLSETLEVAGRPRRCLRASGGSNGQSLAGATSTGTHGGGLFLGAVHDTVVGLHLVTGPDKHVWLERNSYPVVTDDFVNILGAEVIKDDTLFNAAIVSFGSFGFINGLLVETEPLFLLKELRFDNVPYTDDLMDALSRVDITKLRQLLPAMPEDGNEGQLYHMEVNLNPFKVAKEIGDGFFLRVFYKVTCPETYSPDHQAEADLSLNPELIALAECLLERLNGNLSAGAIKAMVNQLFDEGMRAPTTEARTIGEIFKATRFRGNVSSFAFGIDSNSLPAVLEHILAVNKAQPFAGGIAVRFVKGTNATLGFTKFPTTCVVEMDGLDTPANAAVSAAVIQRLEAHNINYTMHWGKMNSILNKDRVNKMYGEDKVRAWKESREQLLSPETRAVFTNDFMIQCGLDTPATALDV